MAVNPNQATIDALNVWLTQLNAYEVYAKAARDYYESLSDEDFPQKAQFVSEINAQITALDAQEATIAKQIKKLGG
jgi:hypothetical protein